MPIIQCPHCHAKNRVDVAQASLAQPVCGRCRNPLPVGDSASDHPTVLTDAAFPQFLQSAADRPVLVDCWAPWCGPCRMLTPVIDELARESAGRFHIAKLNVDENPQTAGRFNISSIPTLLIFKAGRLVDQLAGVRPKRDILTHLLAQV